jgi:hypothetical protein
MPTDPRPNIEAALSRGTVTPFPKTNTLAMTMEILSEIGALKPKKGDKGILKCPKCGADFHWSYSGPRAQRGVCSTPNCLSFMA